MAKPLINLALWFRALSAALSVFWRGARADGSLTHPAVRFSLFRHAADAALTPAISTLSRAGGADRAAPAFTFARGRWPWADLLRGATPRRSTRPGQCLDRVGSTTAFGLFDATRERGMGHPAG